MSPKSTLLTQLVFLAVFFLFPSLVARAQTASSSYSSSLNAPSLNAPSLNAGSSNAPSNSPSNSIFGASPVPPPAEDTPSAASDTCSLKHLGKCVEDVGHDQIGIWTSPFHAELRDAEWILPLAGATAVAIHYDGQAQANLGVDQTRIDASNAFSNAAFYGSLASDAGMYIFGVTTHNDHLAETGRLGAEAVADASIMVEGLKLITNRQRPSEGNGQGDFWPNGTRSYEWDGSFPSEHAAAMFALARVISGEYRSKRVAFAAYALAAAVSASRVTARDHFPSDVIVGGAIGYLVGSYVGYHRASDSGTSELFFAPVVDQSTRTYGLEIQFVPNDAPSSIGKFIHRLE